MTPAAARRAAALLLGARRERAPIEALPSACRPATPDEAFAVQDAYLARAGALAGWKIGCTSVEARRILCADGPFPGPVLAGAVQASPAAFAAGSFIRPGVEAEIAFRLGTSLPPRPQGYSREEVADAVASAHPAIEIVESRFCDWLTVGIPSLIADAGCNGGLVAGAGTTEWRGLDLIGMNVRVRSGNSVVGAGAGADAMGDPFAALGWLVGHLGGRGIALDAGAMVTTGTCTGIYFPAPGETVVAEFGPLGTVDVSFEGVP